jgi:NAD(P)-dependent dehydrogenase (short-subunit alcohol dehydrogenase family)
MDLQLAGRVVLVVGGAGYIGSAVVDRLRAEGATAVAASRHLSAAEGIVMDVEDDASVSAAVRRVVAEHGRIDGLVVSAAPNARSLNPADNGLPATVLRAVDVKAIGFLRVANAVLPVMTSAGHGRVVAISGQNAFVTGNIAGSVRNAAVIIAAKNLADSVAGSGVTVNVVSPGIVRDDPATQVEPATGGETSPAQIADLVTFLVSPRSAGVSGESIAVGHRVRGVLSW